MSKRFKKTKRDDQIVIDEKTGQLYIGNKDLRLLMLRPIDIIEFTEFAGTNAEDIILWVGKTIAKYFIEKLFPGETLSDEDLLTKKEVLLSVLETFEHLGYGVLNAIFREKEIYIHVHEAVIAQEKENIMAKNVCILYQGIFSGILEQLEIDVEGEEIECTLLGDEHCVFKYSLLTGQFGDEVIDPLEGEGHISDFLKSL
jgi:predicted hydrocarbon binding protein